MSIFGGIFGKKETPATQAKNRLTAILTFERAATGFEFMDKMREEILEVVKRYINVRNIQVKSHKNQHIDRLDIEIDLENPR